MSWLVLLNTVASNALPLPAMREPPLRSVIATPVFHRWHHSKDPAAIDKNFAGLLPLWDILFGTYYMPKDRLPQDFGATEPVPTGYFGQLWHPFAGWFKRKGPPPLP